MTPLGATSHLGANKREIWDIRCFIHQMSETESGSPEGSPENCLHNRTRIMLIYASDDDDEEERRGLPRLENGGFRGMNRWV